MAIDDNGFAPCEGLDLKRGAVAKAATYTLGLSVARWRYSSAMRKTCRVLSI